MSDPFSLIEPLGVDETDLFNLDNLCYRDEGNNTIVVSNIQTGLILRIRKTNAGRNGYWSKGRTKQAEMFANQRIFLQFGSQFLRSIHLVKTSPTFLYELEKKIEPFRPAYRKIKGVDLSENFVFVTSDATKMPSHLVKYAFGPTLTVEIKRYAFCKAVSFLNSFHTSVNSSFSSTLILISNKYFYSENCMSHVDLMFFPLQPKFGAIPLWPATGVVNLAKNSASLFCLRQEHSSKRSRWKDLSTYCPCDLFSGIFSHLLKKQFSDRDRLVHGLNALLTTPQNNFRVYLDSHPIYSHDIDKLGYGLYRFFHLEHDSISLNKQQNEPPNCFDHQNVCGHSNECQFSNDRDRLIRGTLLEALLHKFDSTNDDLITRVPLNSSDRQPFSMCCALHLNGKFHSTQCGNCHNLGKKYTLPEGCILQRILSVQLLITTDIAFIFPHYKRVCTFLASHGWTW
ncbi:Inositol-pentakisphosphate 2-kinase [Schistosoma japonicum]|nr:Inositol-pentakisphosphate 2-kinase [Schistosoma japonicum]